jgi:hypothetical protein
MKRLRTAAMIASAFLTFATPVLAQGWFSGADGQSFQEWLAKHPNVSNNLGSNPYQIYDPQWRANHPELQEYIQNHPGVWNNLKSQGSGYYDERFNTFLAKHPHSAAELRANPELIYDPRFRKQHPELNDFMASHPSVWRSVKSTYAGNIRPAPIPNPANGAYDREHHWRDYSWWHEHDREWFWKNHPEWAANHSEWRDNDGDFDEHHEWHSRDWWATNHRDWVEAHHPHWFDKHEAHDEWKARKDAEKNASKEAKAESKHHGHGHGHDNDQDNGHGHD